MKSIFDVHAVDAPLYKSQKLRWISWTLAFVVTGLVVAQLASFEDFMVAIANLAHTESRLQTALLAVFITGIEILSLLVLVRLKTSRLMRAVSSAALFVAPLAWIALMLLPLSHHETVSDVGFTGGIIEFELGVVSFGLAVVWLVVALMAWRNLGSWQLFNLKNNPLQKKRS